jgi:hypothetical protein
MPRVNRDLQRRMAARRERERRRPAGDRRYRFETTEPAVGPDETLVADDEVTEAVEAPPPKPARAGRDRPAPNDGAVAARAATKSAPKPFSAYRAEYAYVFADLRRVAIVIGSLLLILVVLYFVLPLLIH